MARKRPAKVRHAGGQHRLHLVGAEKLKPLFIVACSITGVSFFLTLIIERWLRHSGRLAAGMCRRERVISTLAIAGSFIGGCGLILLSIFDTKRHTNLHRLFLLIFVVGVGLSAIFTVSEYWWISRDFVEIRRLRAAYIAKGVIAGILLLFAIAFAVLFFEAPEAGAIVEWINAFGFTFYLLTFFWDLRMSMGIYRGEPSRQRLLVMRQNDEGIAAARGAKVAGGGGVPPLGVDMHAHSDHHSGAAGSDGFAPMGNGYHAKNNARAATNGHAAYAPATHY